MSSFSQITWQPKLVSDSLIVISPSQLKRTNLIFLEHKKLKLVNKELENQISSYQLLYNNSLKIDSVQRQIIYEKDLQIQNQTIMINKQKSVIKYLSVGGIVTILAAILFKK